MGLYADIELWILYNRSKVIERECVWLQITSNDSWSSYSV